MLLFVLAFPREARAAPLIVDQVNGPYGSVGDAIAAAAPTGDTVEIHGGGLFAEAITVNNKDLTIVGVGTAPTLRGTNDDGGFLKLEGGSDLIIQGVIFDGKDVNDQPLARAIKVVLGTVVVEDSVLSSHSGRNEGGTVKVHAAVGNAAHFARNTFSTSDAQDHGGFIAFLGGTGSVTDCTFTGGVAPKDGGAIYVAGGANVTVARSVFVGNRSSEEGGALRTTGPSTVLVTDSRFESNESLGSNHPGGAIFQEGGTGTYLRNIFCDNATAERGGAMTFKGGATATLAYDVFVRNFAPLGSMGGGAIRTEDSTVNISHGTFIGNGAPRGQAIHATLSVGTVAVVDSFFAYHRYGGQEVLFATDNDDLSADHLAFWDNDDVFLGATVIDLGGHQFGNPVVPSPSPYSCNPLDFKPGLMSDLINNASDGSDIGAIVDFDGDGYVNFGEDCNDTDALISPLAIEVIADGIDQDCDLGDLCYADADNDGHGEMATVQSVDLDCNDPGEAPLPNDTCPGFDDNFDSDGDGVVDGCDVCPFDAPDHDLDNDTVCNTDDICPGFDDRRDTDGDGIPNGCDDCSGDDLDSDGDGVADDCDLCEGFDDAVDADGDTQPDGCDACPFDNPDDSDHDGVCEGDDLCPGEDDRLDSDGDGVPDGCDSCVGVDSDGDGACDNVDPCPYDAADDQDGDGLCADVDPCPSNPDRTCVGRTTEPAGTRFDGVVGCGCSEGGARDRAALVLLLAAVQVARRRRANQRSGRAQASTWSFWKASGS